MQAHASLWVVPQNTMYEMTLLAASPVAARDVQALNDLSSKIRDGCRDPVMSGEFPVCLPTVSVPYDHKNVLDGFFFFRG